MQRVHGCRDGYVCSSCSAMIRAGCCECAEVSSEGAVRREDVLAARPDLHVPLRKLGKGGFGCVYKAYSTRYGEEIVLKVMRDDSDVRWASENGTCVPREFADHKRAYEADPDSVVRPLDWTRANGVVVLTMEYNCDFVDLYEFVEESGGSLSAWMSLRVVYAACDALNSLAERGIYHGDVKDENILIERYPTEGPNDWYIDVRVIDFGRVFAPGKQRWRGGTLVFNPPEVFTSGEADPDKATVWALGILLYSLHYGNVPFATRREICTAVLKKKPECANTCQNVWDMVTMMLCANPDERPPLCTIHAILKKLVVCQE